MAQEVTRRDFLTVGGAGVAGLAASLGINSVIGAPEEAHAEVATVTVTTGGREPGEVVDEVAAAVPAQATP